MLSKLGEVGKTVAALIIGLIGWATSVVESASSEITAVEWIGLATVVAIAIGVYSVSNAPASTTSSGTDA